MMEHYLWVEKYRPKKIEDCVLPKALKKTFDAIVKSGEMMNMLLSGPPGIGKTTVAKALSETLHCDSLVINGSLDGNIDTLRTSIKTFASTISITGSKKVVILDEADYLNPTSTQPAMRGVIEEFAKNCRFIFTCNYPNKIIDPIHSRCTCIEFAIPKDETQSLCTLIMKRVMQILQHENVQFDTKVIAAFVKKSFPDFRRILNELQKSVVNGAIDIGIMGIDFEEHFQSLLTALKNGKFKDMEAWVLQFGSADSSLYGHLYNFLAPKVKPASKPQLVIHCNDFDYRNAFCTDHVLNLKAALINIMADCEFI